MKFLVRIVTLLIIAVAFSSCVGNKELAYLQNKEAYGEERFEAETKVEVVQEQYKLKSGDILYLNMEKFRVGEEIFTISNFQQLNRLNQVQHPYLLGYKIDENGTIDLPLLGKVDVAGKILTDLQNELSELASEQYPGSVVEVYQLDGTVSVIGEVQKPGRYPIYKERNTILDLVAMAGDMKDYADRSSVKILRDVDGQQDIFHLDLNSLDVLSQKGYYIQNDDVIIVSPLRRRKYVTSNIQWLVSSVTALVAIASLVVSVTR